MCGLIDLLLFGVKLFFNLLVYIVRLPLILELDYANQCTFLVVDTGRLSFGYFLVQL